MEAAGALPECRRACCTPVGAHPLPPALPHLHRVFLLPNRPADCVWGALAWANSDLSVHVQALGEWAISPFVYFHELGHTLGLEHAGKGGNVYGEPCEPAGHQRQVLDAHAP